MFAKQGTTCSFQLKCLVITVVKKYFQISVIIRFLIFFTIIQLDLCSEEEIICRRCVGYLLSFWLHCLATHVCTYSNTLAIWGWVILSMYQLLLQCLTPTFQPFHPRSVLPEDTLMVGILHFLKCLSHCS